MSGDRSFEDFLTRVEGHSAKSFRYKSDVGVLLRAARTAPLRQVFADAVFHATFVVKTKDVMQRIGRGGEGFDTLSAQFSEGLERVTTLLKTLIKEESDRTKADLGARYLSMDQESVSRLLELLSDLALIKHWEIDGHSLPFDGDAGKRSERTKEESSSVAHLKYLTLIARLALVMFALLLLIDGPVTGVGWVTSFVLGALLFIIQYQAAKIRNEQV